MMILMKKDTNRGAYKFLNVFNGKGSGTRSVLTTTESTDTAAFPEIHTQASHPPKVYMGAMQKLLITLKQIIHR